MARQAAVPDVLDELLRHLTQHGLVGRHQRQHPHVPPAGAAPAGKEAAHSLRGMGAAWLGRDHVEEALTELADEALQRSLWTSSESPASFVEAVEQLFTDSALGDALDKGSAFDPATDDLLRRLNKALRRVDGRRSPEEVIADPLMSEVRALATEALDSLSQHG